MVGDDYWPTKGLEHYSSFLAGLGGPANTTGSPLHRGTSEFGVVGGEKDGSFPEVAFLTRVPGLLALRPC